MAEYGGGDFEDEKPAAVVEQKPQPDDKSWVEPNKIQIIKSLGTEGQADKYLCIDRHKVLCIVTRVPATSEATKAQEMLAIKHPYLLPCRFTIMHNKPPRCVLIGTQFADCTPLDAVIEAQRKKDEPFPEEWIIKWAAELLLGLEPLHKKGKSHKRLLPSNLYITKDRVPGTLMVDVSATVVSKPSLSFQAPE